MTIGWNLDFVDRGFLSNLVRNATAANPSCGSVMLPLQLTVDPTLDHTSDSILRMHVPDVEKASSLKVYGNNLHVRKYIKSTRNTPVMSTYVAGVKGRICPDTDGVLMYAGARPACASQIAVLGRSVNVLIGTLAGFDGKHWLINTYTSEGPFVLQVRRQFLVTDRMLYNVRVNLHNAIYASVAADQKVSNAVDEWLKERDHPQVSVPTLLAHLFYSSEAWSIDDLRKLGIDIPDDQLVIRPDKPKWYSVAGYTARLRTVCPVRFEDIERGKVDLDKIEPGLTFDDLSSRVDSWESFLRPTLKDSDGYRWIYIAKLSFKPRDKEAVLNGVYQIL